MQYTNDREFGYGERGYPGRNDYDRNFNNFDRGFRGDWNPRFDNRSFGNREFGNRPYGRELHRGDQMTFRPQGSRHHPAYDRDFGDRLREGWNDVKRGVQHALPGHDEPRARYDKFDRHDRGW